MTTQQVLDKQGLNHYANKMCNAENRKVGSKSLPTALNDIDTAIDGFKTLFDNEYGTPVNAVIENSANNFTIGVGNGIDKRNEVENSFTDIELSGNSMVNCILPNTFTSSNNMKEQENNPVYNNGTIKMTSFGSINQTRFSPKFERGIIKPNTDYTFVFNVSQNSLSGQTFLTYVDYTDTSAHNVSPFSVNNAIQGRKTGIFKYCIRSKSDLSDCNILFRTLIWNDSKEGETITFSVMILEGDYTNKPLPSYFEGLKSVGENEENKISILSNNKNLLDETKFYDFFYNYNSDGIKKQIIDGKECICLTCNGNYLGLKKSPIKFKEKTAYTFSFNGAFYKDNEFVTNWNAIFLIKYTDGTSDGIGFGNKGFTQKSFTSNPNKTIEAFTASYQGGELLCIEKGTFMITEGTQITEYEPYKQDKKEILLNEPLRGLPNGVKDTIEKINGEWKIIRRCGEITLDDNLFWSLNNTENTHLNTNRFIAAYPQNKGAVAGYPFIGMCDTLPVYSAWSDTAHLGVTLGSPRTIFVYKKDCTTSTEFTRWIKENPAKVVYKLETPIIEDIDPVVLQCWKDGSIFIDETIPVETTHTVALNKTAQIQSNIEELTSLRNRVQKIEEQYNSTILTQAYQTILLNFDNDL